MKPSQSTESLEINRLRIRIAELEHQLQSYKSGVTVSSDASIARETPLIGEELTDNGLLNSLLHHIDDGVIVVNAAGEIILFNAVARRLIGIAQVPGSNAWTARYDCFYPDRITRFPPVELPLNRVLRGETIRDELVYIVNEAEANGVLVNVSAMTLTDPATQAGNAIVIFEDVTVSHQQINELDRLNNAIVKAKQKIKSQQKLFESILEKIDIGITVANDRGEFTLFNSAARRLLGAGPVSGIENWTPKDGCFRMDGELYHADELPLARALGGETVHGEKLYIYNPETKKKVLLSVSALPVNMPPFDVDGAICLFYDITGEQEAKALFENVLNNIEIAVTLVDSCGEMILFNPAARRLLGVGPIDGKDKWGEGYGIYRLDGQPYASEDLPLTRALHGERVHDEVLRVYNPERDQHLFLSVTATPFINTAGNLTSALCFAYDITETAEAQQQVALSEERFRAFMTNLPAVAFIKDAEGRYLYGNDAFFEYHQTTSQQIESGNVTDYDLTSFASAEIIRANDKQIISGEVPIKMSEVLVNQAGESTWFDVYKFRLTGPSNENLLAGIAVDITVRREHARRLEADEKLLRDMIELQEKERLLVAHDIHDGFVQEVVGAKMLSEALRAQFGKGANDKTSHQFEQISCALNRAIDDARRLVSELRPLVIDEEGIVEAIRYLIAEKRYAESIKITFIPQGPSHYHKPLLEGNLFRIVQESLNNIIRHSEAGSVSIDLKSDETQITLSITDDGIGFNPKDLPFDRFGIRGMRERARIFGGKLEVRSHPGSGTTIKADIPLKKSSKPIGIAD